MNAEFPTYDTLPPPADDAPAPDSSDAAMPALADAACDAVVFELAAPALAWSVDR